MGYRNSYGQPPPDTEQVAGMHGVVPGAAALVGQQFSNPPPPATQTIDTLKPHVSYCQVDPAEKHSSTEFVVAQQWSVELPVELHRLQVAAQTPAAFFVQPSLAVPLLTVTRIAPSQDELLQHALLASFAA